MKTLPLTKEAAIPILGFGTWQLTGEVCQRAIHSALEIGLRHIDTADAYENHRDIANALKSAGLKREELFITSKVWRDSLEKQAVLDSCQRFLEELSTPYLDLLLIHWPNSAVPIEETLEAFASLKEKGLIKAIGVSNFTHKHLEKALQTGIEISNNQIEFHPSLNQVELKKYCDEHHIVVTAYSPLAQGMDLTLPEIVSIAQNHQADPSQIILAWLRAKDIVAIPRSLNPKYIESNFKSLELALTPEEITRIDSLNSNNRIVKPSFAEFNI